MRASSTTVAICVGLLALSGCKKDGAAAPEAYAGAQSAPAAAPPAAAPAAAAPAAAPAAQGPVPTAQKGLPDTPSPADNPTTPQKVALGHALFFDARLSKDDSMGCVGCHQPAQGWVVNEALSKKVGGAVNTRSAPTMLNVGYHKEFYWDGRMPTLEAVSNAAWKGQLGADPAAVAQKLGAVAGYVEKFKESFGEGPTADNIPKALAAFLRALQSGDTAFDRFTAGDNTALTQAQQNGWKVFTQAGCISCHVPPLFTDLAYHNVGIGSGKPEAERDNGRANHTKADGDKLKFKTPTLRDISKTGPYFHDGSVATLEEAIKLMAGGGVANPGLDPLLRDHKLSAADLADLKAFLLTLDGKHSFTGAPAALP